MVRKFEWYASESAPKDYPAYLLTSFLVLQDGAIEGIPSDRVVNSGWGQPRSIEIIGDPLKAPPHTLNIRWFDLIARKGYGGEIKLDADAIADAMQGGLRNEDGGRPHGIDALVFGMAPGGDLAIWVTGGRVSHLVAMHRIPPADIPVEDMSKDPSETLATFSEDYLNLLFPDGDWAGRAAPPADLWQEYNQRTAYRPLVTGEFEGDLLWISFLNGETDWFDLSGKRAAPTSAVQPGLALPSEAELSWYGPTGTRFAAQVVFDSEEVRHAFQKLASQSDIRPIIIEFEPVEKSLKVDAFLRAGALFYKFEKTTSQVWAP